MTDGLAKGRLAENLQKLTPGVRENLRLDQESTVDSEWVDLHFAPFSPDRHPTTVNMPASMGAGNPRTRLCR
ncbi:MULTISPECIES: hypothetical protein [Nonomuraea]|uniref:hypothetical protein n=1 Tax=Nonomuraea TaxID=83681 RepID=UPI001FEBDA4A|nr:MULTISPECIES: hypothetical protein [Nonomuraea]